MQLDAFATAPESALDGLRKWLNDRRTGEWIWFCKRLSGNDTLANGSHQSGTYLPNDLVFRLFESFRTREAPNPDASIRARVSSHGLPESDVRIVWYNQRTRDECRITRWGGRASPMLDPESTGTLAVLAFRKPAGREADFLDVWVSRFVGEEDLIEEQVGEVPPGEGQTLLHARSTITEPGDAAVALPGIELPQEWAVEFPSAQAIADMAFRIAQTRGLDADGRLVLRRNTEFDLFLKVEDEVVRPRVQQGFADVEQFVDFANTVLNRRKARSGRSLELQAKRVLEEERVSFSHGEVSEGAKRPDFLFPSATQYWNKSFPREQLRMLAVKTTCKDRWRQILNEADDVRTKHLLTIQEGIGTCQHG